MAQKPGLPHSGTEPCLTGGRRGARFSELLAGFERNKRAPTPAVPKKKPPAPQKKKCFATPSWDVDQLLGTVERQYVEKLRARRKLDAAESHATVFADVTMQYKDSLLSGIKGEVRGAVYAPRVAKEMVLEREGRYRDNISRDIADIQRRYKRLPVPLIKPESRHIG